MTPASFQEQLEHLLKNMTFITSMASQKVEWKEITPEESVERVEQEIAEARAAIQELVTAELNNLITDIQNPYPEDVFSELDPDEYPKIDEFARTRGYRIDRISGTLMRRGWLVYKHQLEKEVDERFDALSSNQKEETDG